MGDSNVLCTLANSEKNNVFNKHPKVVVVWTDGIFYGEFQIVGPATENA